MIPILILKMIPKKTCNMRTRISSATFTQDELKMIHSVLLEASKAPEKGNQLRDVMFKIKALIRPKDKPKQINPIRIADLKKSEQCTK